MSERHPNGFRWKNLYAGEHEVLSIAREQKADLVLLDERSGREYAKALGLAYTGTLGILIAAAKQDILNQEEAEEALDNLAEDEQEARRETGR